MSVYKIVEIVGTSSDSWEQAAQAAIKQASGSLRDMRVAEVVAQDVQMDNNGAMTYRTKLNVSFKVEGTD